MAVKELRSTVRWGTISSLWFGLGLFDALQTVFVMRSEGMHHAWTRLFAVTIAAWLPWALATPLVIGFGRRWAPVRPHRFSTWLGHAAVCAVIGTIFAGWQAVLEVCFNPYADPTGPGPLTSLWCDRLLNGMLSSLVLYAGIITLSYALDSRARLAFEQTRTARLNERLSRAQLEALQRQIEPHFLFNTLNAVAGLIREGRGDAAVGTIVKLSDFLRRTLNDTARAEVPLCDELAFVQQYLDIQKVRFAERLELRIAIPGELAGAAVPYLILQPIVENAVKHGIARCVQGGAIDISAERRDEKLVLRVGNDGPSLPAGEPAPLVGIGIANVRSRLQRLYGSGCELSLRNRAGGGVEAAIVLPVRAGDAGA